MKLSRIALLLAGVLLLASCATKTRIKEPQFDSKDPSLKRLMLFIGKDRQDPIFKKFLKKYDIFQKKYGKEGRFYPQDNAFSYWYYQNKIVKLSIAVQQPSISSRFKSYTGKLPFKLKRCDTYDSVKKKLGKPSSAILDKTFIEYKNQNLTIKFMNGRVSTIIIKAK